MHSPKAFAVGLIGLLSASVVPAGAVQAQSAASSRIAVDRANMSRMSTAQRLSLRDRAADAARDARLVDTGERISCHVTEARLIGFVDADHRLFEVACRGSNGYLIDASSTSPRAFDCRVLTQAAAAARAEGQQVPQESVCILEGNT